MARLVLPGSQPNGCNSMEAGPLKTKRSKKDTHPDELYRATEEDMPWAYAHLFGGSTPWDEAVGL